MAIEIVDFPIKNGGSFHSYVSLPEGKSLSRQATWSRMIFGALFFRKAIQEGTI